MLKKLKEKAKDSKFWLALSGAIMLLANQIGKAFGIFVNGEAISELVMSVCEVMIILGFVNRNNQTNSKAVSAETKKPEEEILPENLPKTIEADLKAETDSKK